MEKTLVLYRSRYGYTKRYAEMIAEELGCGLREASRISAEDLAPYDTLIFGGGLYASAINGVNIIRDHFDLLQEKHIAVWATGINAGSPEVMERVWRRNFPEEIRKNIRTFYLRGGFDYGNLSPLHKIMMTGLKWKIKASKNQSEENAGLLKAYQRPENHCDRRNIAGLVTYVRSSSEITPESSGPAGPERTPEKSLPHSTAPTASFPPHPGKRLE